MEAKGLKIPKVYDPDVVAFAKKAQDSSKDIWGFGQTLNRSDDGDGFMSNILWDYGGGVWDKDGKPALGSTFLKQNTAALQFAVDTIKKHGIQPPGVMGWTDVSNNEAYMAGKLVTTNNGASLYYAMVSKKHELAPKTLCVLTPGGPAGSFVGSSCYNWAIFQKSQKPDLCEDLIRYLEDEKRFSEYAQVSVGQAGPRARESELDQGSHRISDASSSCRRSTAASRSPRSRVTSYSAHTRSTISAKGTPSHIMLQIDCRLRSARSTGRARCRHNACTVQPPRTNNG